MIDYIIEQYFRSNPASNCMKWLFWFWMTILVSPAMLVVSIYETVKTESYQPKHYKGKV